MSGELQEHIVQGRSTHPRVIELNPGICHGFQDGLQGLGSIIDRSHQCSLVSSGDDVPGHVRGEHTLRALDVRDIVDRDLHALSSHKQLQLIAGALRNNASLVDDSNVVGELVCFLQVLGGEQNCGAAGH